MELSPAVKTIICITIGIFATQGIVFGILAGQGLIVLGEPSNAINAAFISYIASFLAGVWVMILADKWVKHSKGEKK